MRSDRSGRRWKDRSGVEPHPFLKVGERVRVTRGSLTGVEGILVRKKNLYRLVLSVDMLAQSVGVEVDASDVEPVSRSPRSAIPSGPVGEIAKNFHPHPAFPMKIDTTRKSTAPQSQAVASGVSVTESLGGVMRTPPEVVAVMRIRADRTIVAGILLFAASGPLLGQTVASNPSPDPPRLQKRRTTR